MGLVDWLFRPKKSEASTSIDKFVEAMSIDVSGPEFRDLYPTLDEWKARLNGSGAFRGDSIDWIACTAFDIANGSSGHAAILKAVVRAGPLLSRDELKEAGLNVRRKVGRRFVDSISGCNAASAMQIFEETVLVTLSVANKLHNLRRFEETGIQFVELLSAKDERDTDFENTIQGRRLTIREAKNMIKEHEKDIVRSVFVAIVEF